jgi:hypothetical protein
MALSQSALLEILDTIKEADVADRVSMAMWRSPVLAR